MRLHHYRSIHPEVQLYVLDGTELPELESFRLRSGALVDIGRDEWILHGALELREDEQLTGVDTERLFADVRAQGFHVAVVVVEVRDSLTDGEETGV